MTTPPLIDAARELVWHLDLKLFRAHAAALHPDENHGTACGYGSVKYRAVAQIADALDDLPPDAVIVRRSLLIEAAQALLCTGMFGDIAVTLHVAASGERKA